MPLYATATPATAPKTGTKAKVTVQWLPPYKVVVFNNDYNTFDEVIAILMAAVPGLSLPEAVGLTYEIHLTGAAVPYRGMLDEAEQVAAKIRTIGVKVALEPDA